MHLHGSCLAMLPGSSSGRLAGCAVEMHALQANLAHPAGLSQPATSLLSAPGEG